jgi:predicted ribosome quality control (RQC) complex YloA/Tae2 family protein
MLTDWILMRRVAAELERELRGARVTDAGVLDDGRFALRFSGRRGRGDITLAVDLFGSPPLVSLEPEELSVGGDPGWTRTVATALRGTRAGEVRSRRGDRVLVIDFGTTSRFGVASGAKLVLELIPRFGNALVLRDGLVIAAAKQFSPAENETRSVSVGGPYRPPPLPEARLDDAGFAPATMTADRAGLIRALGAVRPLVPRAVAESFVVEAEALPWPSPGRRAAWLLERADRLLSTLAGSSDGIGPIHVYRSERLEAAHVVPLAQFADMAHTTAPALLPLFAEARATSAGRRSSDAGERRRSALVGRIARRRATIDGELAQITARRDDAAGRDALRIAGDALYTYGHLVPEGATHFTTPDEPAVAVVLDPDLDAKGNAARYFARYRKAADALPHLEARLTLLGAKRDALDELAFEAERADLVTLTELTATLDELEGRKPVKAPQQPRAARKPLRIERPSGARIFVGRSPRENVEVTFKIARPDDLWFHARGIPGSHVVLQPPPGGAPDDTDLDATAARRRRRASRSISPSASTYASSATSAPASSGTPTPARERAAPKRQHPLRDGSFGTDCPMLPT